MTTIVTTSGSSTLSQVLTSTTVVAVSTSTTVSGPRLNEDGGSENSGLSDNDKKIVIGTVVGVGGAILLGGLALVAWRVWGRRRSSPDDDDVLMESRNHSLAAEKPSSAGTSNPFKTTLDQYHTPAPVNTASNF